ncbi:type II secretion system protein M [Seohaeicola saemankumensis]|nr:type II secretion system protein GspM [Seohaeicola saemankumensis]MCA0873491.1 type II secretion system protein M [Seohaeicola saemankumensis]
MTDRLIFALLGLTGRERLLLALLCLVALPLALWLGVVEPLQARRDAARSDLAAARILQHWVSAQAADSARIGSGTTPAETPPIGVSGLEQSLISAGLRDHVSDLSRRSGDRIELRFDAVPFSDLGIWINRTARGWGYEMTAFRIQQGPEPGLAEARFSLAPRQP